MSEITTLQLSLNERIDLQSVLPVKEGITTLIIIEDIKSKLKITQDEIVEFNIQDVQFPNGNTGIKWNEKGALSLKDVEFTKKEIDTIMNVFNKLDDSKEFPNSLINIYKKIK